MFCYKEGHVVMNTIESELYAWPGPRIQTDAEI